MNTRHLLHRVGSLAPDRQQGSVLMLSVIMIFVFAMVMLGVLGYATIQLRLVRSTINREQAFHIAEAGINYYQWRLAHYTADYWDGNPTGTPGPFVHDYIDRDTNQKIGEYSLEISVPPPGSTIVTITSTGYTVENPSQKRTIAVRYGIPSLAKYSFLSNTDVYIGASSVMNGEMHANGGIRFEGSTNALVQSAKTNRPPGQGYQCYPIHGCSSPFQWRPGIWGSVPASQQAFWRMGVPNVNFAGITSDFHAMELLATGDADLPPSGALGYSLQFNAAGTVKVSRVTSTRAHQTGYDTAGNSHTENLDYQNRTLLYTMPIPANGIIFVRDHVWVEGVVNGRVVVAATKYTTNTSQQARILIPNNITYLAKDGNHVLGLIAEKDILLTYFTPDDLEINAAMIAQNGSYQRYNFSGSLKDTLTVYGSVASFGIAGTYWSSGNGYPNRFTTYDTNLLYSPPPSFPLSSEGYRQISWSSD